MRNTSKKRLAYSNTHLAIHGNLPFLRKYNYQSIPADFDRIVQENQYKFTINPGDTISSILEKVGVSQKDIYILSNAVARHFNLYRLQIGKTIYVSTVRHDNASIVRVLKINTGGSGQILVLRNRDGTYNVSKVQIKKYEVVDSMCCKFCKENISEVLLKNGLDQSCVNKVKKALRTFNIDYTRDIECRFFYKYNISDDNEVIGNVLIMKLDVYHIKADDTGGTRIMTTIYNMHDGYDYTFVDTDGLIHRDESDFILLMPLKKCIITSGFGYRIHPITNRHMYHRGVDFCANIGMDVFASNAGVVIQAGYVGAYGNYVKIKHRNGVYTAYAHLSKIFVKVGQVVKSGDRIALSGNTGRTTGPHLHYEVIMNNKFVDPVKNIKMCHGPEYIPLSKIQEYNATINQKVIHGAKIKKDIEAKNKNVMDFY